MDFQGLFVELWYGNHVVKQGVADRHSKLWLITDEKALSENGRHYFIAALNKTERVPEGKKPAGCGLWFISMGAGPDLLDELVPKFNRVSDTDEKLGNPSLVATLSSASEGIGLLDRVFAMNENMKYNFKHTTLEYEILPEFFGGASFEWDEFNSNSYVSGLLIALGYAPPPSNAVTPGYSKPIPLFVFTYRYATTEDLIEEWKRHYPGF